MTEQVKDPEYWGRNPTEPDLGEVDASNTYLPEMVPDNMDDLLPGDAPSGDAEPEEFIAKHSG